MTTLDALAPLPDPAIRRGTGRPKGGYGRGIISASTLSGSFGYKGNLIDWAKREGWEGGRAGKTFEEVFGRDTDIGTLVHKLIEVDIHGDEPPHIPSEYQEPVDSAFAAFNKWMQAHKMTFVATELNLVDHDLRVGGTMDAVLRDGDGRLAIGDWKTSRKIRSAYLVQVAIYGLLWDSNHAEKITGGFHIIRFSKEHADLDHRHYSELDDAKEQAYRLREAYDADAKLRKRAGE